MANRVWETNTSQMDLDDEKFWTYPASDLVAESEMIERYRPGGYHPVSPGDVFHCRYQVVHKLGFGGFSTVWLVLDLVTREWAALKIGVGRAVSPFSEFMKMREMHRRSEYCIRVGELFMHQGPNGCHACAVTELLGPSLDRVVEYHHQNGSRLAPRNILRITGQLLRAISQAHAARYCHGDISAANIIFSAPGLKSLPKEELFERTGQPLTALLVSKDGPLADGQPKFLVKSADWPGWGRENEEEDIRIIDWGQAFYWGQEPERLAEPIRLQVPEGIITGMVDYRVDLWRAGCIIYLMLFGTYPVEHVGGHEAIFAQMIHLVEDVPPEWQDEWEDMLYESEAHDFISDEPLHGCKLRKKFSCIPEPELWCLFPIVEGLMRFRPEDRLSAECALRYLLESSEMAQR